MTYTTIINRYRNKCVRDLAWVLDSPALLDPQQPDSHIPMVSDKQCHELRHQFSAWLNQLDQDPSQLIEWMTKHRSHRLGYYFESLVEFWLRQVVANGFFQSHVQVKKGNQTLGEFDFLFAEKNEEVCQHWETAVKFYLYHHDTPTQARWYGPNAKDRLDIKLDHLLSHQLRLGQTVEGKALLQHFGFNRAHSRLFLKGYLFYPILNSPDAGQSDIILSKRHLRGWWVRLGDMQKLNVATESQWIILSKQQWLSPHVVYPEDATQPMHWKYICDQVHSFIKDGKQNCMLAEFSNDRTGIYKEISRGFVVPDSWPN